MSIVETITLTDTSRLVVSYDEDCGSWSPRDWNNGASVHPLRMNDHYAPPAPGLDSHSQAIEDILEWVPFRRWERGYFEARNEAIAKHFTRAGIPFVIHEHNADRDWVGECVWYVEPDSTDGEGWDEASLRGEIDTYDKWAAGEVYIVDLERLETYVKQHADRTEHGFEVDLTRGEPEIVEEWERVADVGDCYLDDQDYPAEVVAKEHFDLTDEEVAGMEVKLAAYHARVAAREAAQQKETA